ncbi:MAG: dihydroorotase [Bacteroidota bacterium]
MSSILFRQIRIIDPQSPFHEQEVDMWVKEGIVDQIAPSGTLEGKDGSQVIHVEGLHLSPGWIDTGVVLADPGLEYKESLESLAMAAASGGFTQVMCFPNTHPPLDNHQVIRGIQQRSANGAADLLFIGTITEGAAGKQLAEMYDMHRAGVVAYSDGPYAESLSTGLVIRALRYLQAFDGLLMLHPLDGQLGHSGLMNEGVQSTRLGLPGQPQAAETAIVARDVELLNYQQGRVLFHGLSTSRSLELLASLRETNDQVFTAVPGYLLCMNDSELESFDANFKLFPPLRQEETRLEMLEDLKEGKIDLLYSAHHAQSLEEKNLDFVTAEPGMIGLQTFFPMLYAHLVKQGVLSLTELIVRLSHVPRDIFRLPPVIIDQGQEAHFTLFEPDTSWTFNQKKLFSRASNSPFLGREFPAKVSGTLKNGLLMMQQD